MIFRRPAGDGWLALIGGGEFSFGETVDADRAWLAHAPEGPVGFLPAASGSSDYGRELALYLGEAFGREVETIPIYRVRDARRSKNAARIEAAAALYLGAGVAEQLVEALVDTPAAEALLARLRSGGAVTAIGAAAQALGAVYRGLRGTPQPGLSWLSNGVIETNFSPAHDRRLRALLEQPGVSWGLGLPAGSALLMGPAGQTERVGPVFLLREADADLEVLDGSSDS